MHTCTRYLPKIHGQCIVWKNCRFHFFPTKINFLIPFCMNFLKYPTHPPTHTHIPLGMLFPPSWPSQAYWFPSHEWIWWGHFLKSLLNIGVIITRQTLFTGLCMYNLIFYFCLSLRWAWSLFSLSKERQFLAMTSKKKFELLVWTLGHLFGHPSNTVDIRVITWFSWSHQKCVFPCDHVGTGRQMVEISRKCEGEKSEFPVPFGDFE